MGRVPRLVPAAMVPATVKAQAALATMTKLPKHNVRSVTVNVPPLRACKYLSPASYPDSALFVCAHGGLRRAERIEALKEEIAALKKANQAGGASGSEGASGAGDSDTNGKAEENGAGGDGDADGSGDEAKSGATEDPEVVRLRAERLTAAEVRARCVTRACQGLGVTQRARWVAVGAAQAELAKWTAVAEEASAKAIADSRARDKAVRCVSTVGGACAALPGCLTDPGPASSRREERSKIERLEVRRRCNRRTSVHHL